MLYILVKYHCLIVLSYIIYDPLKVGLFRLIYMRYYIGKPYIISSGSYHHQVPAYFFKSDSQHQATKDAGLSLDILCIINEPTTAAIAHSLDKKVEGECNVTVTVLIFDLSREVCNASLLTIEGCIFEISPPLVTPILVVRTLITVSSTTSFRSSSASTRRVSHLLSKAESSWVLILFYLDISFKPRVPRCLRTACERAKHTLSSAT